MALSHVSITNLNSFDECSLKWEAIRLDKVPELPSLPLIEGTLAHRCIELLTNALYESELDMVHGTEIDSIVQGVFKEHPRALSTESYEAVLVTVKTFAKHFRLNPDSVIGIEMECLAEFDPDIPPMLTYIDYAELCYDEQGEFIGITDHKTFWSQSQKERDKWQLVIQAWQLKQCYPNARIAVRNWFVRANKKTEWFFPSDFEIASALNRARLIYARMEASFNGHEYAANPGDHCGHCPIALTTCSIAKLLSAGKQIVTEPEGGKSLIRQALVAGAAYDQAAKALKKYVDATGPLMLDETRGAMFVTSADSLTADPKDLYAAMGEEFWDLVNIDGKKLRKLEDDSRVKPLLESKPGKTQFKLTGTAKEEVTE